MTYSADSNGWLKSGEVIFYLGLGYESSITAAPLEEVSRLFYFGSPELSQQYRIKITSNQAKGFRTLLQKGAGIAYPGDIYIVSSQQLEALRQNGVGFELL
jgi:hypothetical protein